MRSIILTLLIISNSIVTESTTPYIKAKQGGDWTLRNIIGFVEFSDLYHPHTKKYLENLCKKYPDQFTDTSFYIIPSLMSPAATFQSIYLPIYWTEKIEQEFQLNKKNGLFSQATEWIALHEAGHIKNNDAANQFFSSIIYIFLKHTYEMIEGEESPSEKLKKLMQNKPKMMKSLLGLLLVSKGYWIWREYRADQFATKHCSNPESIIAAYEWLERIAPAGILPGITHSFKEYRLQRIAHQFKEKFGYAMPKTYHPTDRVTA